MLSGIYLLLCFRLSASFFLLFSFLFCLRGSQSIINSKRHPLNLMDFKRFFFMDVLISKIMACQRVLNATLNHSKICSSQTIFDLLCCCCCWDFVQCTENKATTITWRILAQWERRKKKRSSWQQEFRASDWILFYVICRKFSHLYIFNLIWFDWG